MRPFLAALCALVAACTPIVPPTLTAPPSASLPPVPAPRSPAPTPLAQESPPAIAPQAILESQSRRLTIEGITVHLFLCDDRRVNFSVADQENGPGSEWSNGEAAGRSHRALAAINGGFFTPEGAPLGLVIENGAPFGSWNRASSLTSGVFTVHEGSPAIRRSTTSSRTATPRHLLQTGPFLVERGAAVSGLSNSRNRPRSFLLWDGRHHWALGYAESTTLATLAKALASQPEPELQVQTALNLDGGSSSQLWIDPKVKGGPAFHRPLWRKPVRNFILAHEKS